MLGRGEVLGERKEMGVWIAPGGEGETEGGAGRVRGAG